MRYKISEISVLALGVVTIFIAQFSIPTLFGADGYLHIRMAEFLRLYGMRYDFHWARFSTFAQHFADKDFLYHVLLIPFTFLPNILTGAKVSAAMFASALFVVFWLMLRRYCQSRPLIIAAMAAFFSSANFLDAIFEARNMTLVIILTMLFVHCLVHKRRWWLFVITAAYSLSHVSGPYLLLFAVLGEGVRFINEREFSWRAITAVAAGLILGFLIHPNFPNNFLSFYLNGILVPVFALKWGLELGAEFFPLSTREFVLSYPFIFIATLVFIILGLRQKKRTSTGIQIWLAVAGYFFVFSFFSRRYLIHAYPMVLVAAAGYISEWWQESGRAALVRWQRTARYLLSVLAVIFLAAALAVSYRDFRRRTAGETVYNQHFEAVGKWLDINVPPGELIFHTNWSDSQYLIGMNPKDDYFVTLDPIYMYYQDPEKYKLYRNTAFGGESDPYAVLKNEFGVTYGYAGKNYFLGLINQIRQDKRFSILAEDGLGVVFRLNRESGQ